MRVTHLTLLKYMIKSYTSFFLNSKLYYKSPHTIIYKNKTKVIIMVDILKDYEKASKMFDELDITATGYLMFIDCLSIIDEDEKYSKYSDDIQFKELLGKNCAYFTGDWSIGIGFEDSIDLIEETIIDYEE